MACARILHPILQAEGLHAEQPNIIYRGRELGRRVTCGKLLHLQSTAQTAFTQWFPSTDVCNTGLFSQTWFCTSCGREICLECAKSLSQVGFIFVSFLIVTRLPSLSTEKLSPTAAECAPGSRTTHPSSALLPVTRFQDDELLKLTNEMDCLLQSEPARLVLYSSPCFATLFLTDLPSISPFEIDELDVAIKAVEAMESNISDGR